MDDKKRNFKDDMKKANTELSDRLTKLEDHEKSEAEKVLEDALEDIRTDLDKMTEYFDDKIGNLKDMIDQTRSNAHEAFTKENGDNEYVRNRKRIQDINQVYEMYSDKMKKNSKRNLN